jgi:hypothetical protein
MGELIQLRLQLVMLFKPIFFDGSYDEVEISFGPFANRQALKKWHLAFIGYFQEGFEQEPEIDECTIPSSDVQPYDPREVIFYPQDPWLAAQEALDLMLFCMPRAYEDDSAGPFLWRALARLTMQGYSLPVDIPAVSGPFRSTKDITAWCTQLNDAIKGKISHLGVVSFEFQCEEIVRECQHEFSEEEYLFNAERDPTKEGEDFFSSLMRDMIATRNVRI